jgi:hypothetical protein
VFDRDLAVRIHILFAVKGATDTLKLSIHEQEIAYRVERLREGSFLVLAHLDHAAMAKPKRDFGVTLEIANTVRPLDLGGLDQDSRWLGLAVNWVELEPV